MNEVRSIWKIQGGLCHIEMKSVLLFFSCILRKIQEAEVEVAKIQMVEQGREDQKGEHQRDREGYGCFGYKSR